MGPIVDIMPKDRYQIPQILPRIYQLMFPQEEKIAEHDKKVEALKK